MSTFVFDTLRSSWGIPASLLSILPYQVDAEFFNEKWAESEDRSSLYILSVGRESRDYETLIEAVRDLPVNVIIAAGSIWARVRDEEWRTKLPTNVSVTTRDYLGLRDLYANCEFVVVPLFETAIQDGITTIEEAMAMGKAVVVTRTRGQGDLIADDQVVLPDGSGRSTVGYYARYYAPKVAELHGPTGIYVPPGDVLALRAAIEKLLNDPPLAKELGTRGRLVCESIVSLDQFVERVLQATGPYLR